MTKIQLLQREIKDWKTKYKNLEAQTKDIFEERKYLYETIRKMDIKMDSMSKEIDDLKKENKLLKEIISKQEDQINNLKSRLKKDSNNSSKPPSSDGFKKKIHNSREKSGKKPGGQKGHKGTNLKISSNPTEKVDLVTQDLKCNCGGRVKFDYSKINLKRQVVDIEILTKIIEYRNFEGICNKCNTEYTTVFPNGVNTTVQYGENLKTLVAMLVSQGMVSIDRTVELVEGLSEGKIKMSKGTVVNFNKELANKCEPIVEELKKYLIKSNVLFVDETGVRINGKLNWLHTACTEDTSVFMIDKARGNDATDTMGILAYYVGILMHDHLKSYYNYNTMEHAECNAHIVRYLKSIIEIFKRDEAQDFLKYLIELNNEKKDALKDGVKAYTEAELTEKENSYLAKLNIWKEKYLEGIKGKKNIKYFNDEKCLINRLIKYKDEHLKFIKDFQVPFDNNLAERALRMIKTKTKVSGGFRSEEGANNFATIRSVIDTIKKRGLDLFPSITNVFKGNSILLNK